MGVDRVLRTHEGEQSGAQEIIGTRAWDTAIRTEDPPRQATGTRRQQPALAGRDIAERKARRRRPDQLIGGADTPEIVERGIISAEQQMVAVGDPAAKPALEKGRAAAAGRGPPLM